jgi:general secretion pathway protein H
MQSRDYALLFTTTGYRFYIYDYTKPAWVEAADDKLLRVYELHPQLSLALALDGREVELKRSFKNVDIEKPEPQVMLLSSGEVTPFKLEVSREGRPGRFELTGDLDGTLKVSEVGFDGR